MAWTDARAAAYEAGIAARREPVEVPLAGADGRTLACALSVLTDPPAFDTSSADGCATRGRGPRRVVAGTKDDDSFPAGVPVTPGVIGLAAASGYDTVLVAPAIRVAVVVFGDELLTSGLPGRGRIRDSVGPQLPAWLRRFGATPVEGFAPMGPVEDTLDAHVAAIRAALEHADVVCTAGGTMRGPVDHVRPALKQLRARFVVDTVAVRPGFPMLLAEITSAQGPPRFVAGLPGNPQSAVVGLVTLVAPLLLGLAGATERPLPTVRLAAPAPGRGPFTGLVLVRIEEAGALPVMHAASAMLRGLARSDGFAVIAPGTDGRIGATVPLAPLPLPPGGRP